MTQGMGHITGQDISRAQLSQVAWQRAVNQLTRLQRAIYDDQSGWLKHKRRTKDPGPVSRKKPRSRRSTGAVRKRYNAPSAPLNASACSSSPYAGPPRRCSAS